MIRRIAILTLLGLVVGIGVGALAIGFVEIVLWLNDHFYLTRASRESTSNLTLVTALTIGIPTAGGVIVGSLSKYMPGNRFHGPQDVIKTAQTLNPSMPVRRSVLSTLAAGVSLGSGASVGQYGPLVHMGASVGSWISRATKSDRSVGMIGIACGCAAAISAAFHAPIAGLVFSREVVLRHYSLRAFAPIAVSSILAYVVAHVVLKRAPLFRVENLMVSSPWEYLVFVIIGITGAIVATVFMRAIELASSSSRKLSWPMPVKTGLAGLALGVVALQVPDVLGIGQDVLRMAISGDTLGSADLAQIMLAKMLVTALCLGFGFAGGVFSPALLIGALYGALIGTGAEWLVGDMHSPIGIYAVCGMVAVTGPVIGAPLTAVLIVFELTQNFDLATAALASGAFANLVGFRIYGRSYFDVQLQAQGFDLSLGRDKVIAQQHTIRHHVSMEFTRAKGESTLRDIRDALVRHRRSEAYVVDRDGHYVGTLTLHRLMELTSGGISLEELAAEHARPEALVLSPDESIWAAMSKIEDFIGESIPVVENNQLIGVLFESTIVSAYLNILDSNRQEENAAV
ncbi:MAG: chloride channel protein [Gammaproteobacteria bacterium]|nr:chloride channel protein [Gammaproteobacteria bacterium]MDH3820217.1 chloride channel protein [Gammaproteobacteria bacterium]